MPITCSTGWELQSGEGTEARPLIFGVGLDYPLFGCPSSEGVFGVVTQLGVHVKKPEIMFKDLVNLTYKCFMHLSNFFPLNQNLPKYLT